MIRIGNYNMGTSAVHHLRRSGVCPTEDEIRQGKRVVNSIKRLGTTCDTTTHYRCITSVPMKRGSPQRFSASRKNYRIRQRAKEVLSK